MPRLRAPPMPRHRLAWAEKASTGMNTRPPSSLAWRRPQLPLQLQLSPVRESLAGMPACSEQSQRQVSGTHTPRLCGKDASFARVPLPRSLFLGDVAGRIASIHVLFHVARRRNGVLLVWEASWRHGRPGRHGRCRWRRYRR